MNVEEIITNITSRDKTKVLKASHAIIRLGQDAQKMQAFIEYLEVIKKSTQNLKTGGLLAPNQRFIAAAIKTIAFHRDADSYSCACELFGIHNCMDPTKEDENGYLKINKTTRIDGKWVDFYEASCTRCEQKFKIKEGDYHYTWWKWERIN